MDEDPTTEELRVEQAQRESKERGAAEGTPLEEDTRSLFERVAQQRLSDRSRLIPSGGVPRGPRFCPRPSAPVWRFHKNEKQQPLSSPAPHGEAVAVSLCGAIVACPRNRGAVSFSVSAASLPLETTPEYRRCCRASLGAMTR